ncbi:hypothetical protein NLI96_g9216 [Meripilus lineatus]|uniref:Nucleoside phosphorylase domain-containing protein n=1 Tax=Meripilus lineatus TaxID=2056292 RepID=A0AAD5YFF3_9APHY|nr:hypothetical protein NLI96_g9216 [Physisporinus lineatus]
MKDLVVDANFPRTLDERVYHLGIKAGEVANRVITVGSPSRARRIATYLDGSPKTFELSTERGFLTFTGRYKGVPVSIISIGMGSPNMDFFVNGVSIHFSIDSNLGRNFHARLGSCGALIDVRVGSIVIPSASIAVNRNYDYDFINGSTDKEPYRVSNPVLADSELCTAVRRLSPVYRFIWKIFPQVQGGFERTRPSGMGNQITINTLNASTDSFYSTQGRITSFPDHNAKIIEDLKSLHTNLATFEMETFHLFHLARSWPAPSEQVSDVTPPISSQPAALSISPQQSIQHSPVDVAQVSSDKQSSDTRQPRIRAASAQMVFAARGSRDFIKPEDVVELEGWCARAVLEAVTSFKIDTECLHEEKGSVWELP